MRFRVNGLPAPQGSKNRNRAGALYESSRAVGPWREAVRSEAQRARERYIIPGMDDGHAVMGSTVGLSVTVVFVLPRPKSHFGTGRNKGIIHASAPRFPAGRPDVDKLARAVLDGLKDGGVIADDAQVVGLYVDKVYARDGEAPGALIDVEAM